jgi:hypothetical protein
VPIRRAWENEVSKEFMNVVEAVDGNSGNAYAWLALGSFSDARLAGSPVSDEIEQWSKIVTDYRTVELLEPIRSWAKANPGISASYRRKLLSIITYLASDPSGSAIVDALSSRPTPAARVRRALSLDNSPLETE